MYVIAVTVHCHGTAMCTEGNDGNVHWRQYVMVFIGTAMRRQHVMLWAMHSHTFALLIPDGFTQRCDHGITCHCRFRIQYNTHTHAHTPTHTFPLFCISETTRPIEPKFCIRSNHIKTSSWYEAILVMQMKVNDVIMSFVQLRLNLTYRWLVFTQILICCSWDNSLSDKWH